MNGLVRAAALALMGCLAATPGSTQSSVEVSFHLPVPRGWRTETLTFPLTFAPELEYEGLEELRFSPGMFQEKGVDFWSYAFVWWVPLATEFSTERLENDLEIYFNGLTDGVAKAREFDPGAPDFDARLEPVESDLPDPRQWEGKVRTFDVFTTRRPISLNIRIDLLECADQGHTAVFFQLSPQPRRNPIWKVLDEMRQGFRCER
jgi:hypothetical protein